MNEYIFIDTSIFRNENFLKGRKLQELLRLCKEGHFSLVMPLIIVNEIKSQFEKNASLAIEEHNKMMNQKILDPLKNVSDSTSILKKFPKIDVVTAEFDKQLASVLSETNCTILDYPTLNIGSVFDDYFRRSPPFGLGKKRHEFPDAFAIRQLEEWYTWKPGKLIVLTTDKDFQKAANPAFDVILDYEKFLQDELRRTAPERLELLDALFLQNSNFLDNQVKNWVEDALNIDSTYDDYTNWCEVHSIQIDEITVLSKEYEVIHLEQEAVEIEISATIFLKVELRIDDERSGMYDSDDKVILFRDTINLNIEQEIRIPMRAIFHIISKDDYYDECEIEEINEGKDLEIGPEWRDW